MDIDLKKLDYITPIEKEIEELTKENPNNIINIGLIKKTNEEMILYILTIISILYKYKHYIIYEAQKLKKIDHELTSKLLDIVEVINQSIQDLKKDISEKNVPKSLLTIILDKTLITQIIKMYFEVKETNYILERMEIEQSLKTQKTHLKLNPFIINQYLDYEQKRLTEEEMIIADMIEFDKIAQAIEEKTKIKKDENETRKNRIKLIKKQILKNYNENELGKVILFIISNTYQELLDNPKENIFSNIKSIIENEEISNEELIKLFKKSESFSSVIIEKFLEYNTNIKIGRLEELKEKESYLYAKKRYKK